MRSFNKKNEKIWLSFYGFWTYKFGGEFIHFHIGHNLEGPGPMKRRVYLLEPHGEGPDLN